MNDEPTENPIAVVRHQVDSMFDQFKAALPAHIPPERFARTLMTSIQQSSELLAVDRRSLLNAAMRAAQDGLLPDGREGAIVIFDDRRRGKIAQWLPMIAGIRKKVRNSGEIATWECHVVHANDEFQFELGDHPFIRHVPTLEDPGPVIAAYSVATLKSGEISREIMTIDEIMKVREASRAANNPHGPWQQWFDEMARKTVAKRHAKVLPMSTDLDDLLRREDDDGNNYGRQDKSPPPPLHSLASKLDAIAHRPESITEPSETDVEIALTQAAEDALLAQTEDALLARYEVVRERARADAAKKLKRMAPTSLTDAERAVYLQAFDAHRAAEAE